MTHRHQPVDPGKTQTPAPSDQQDDNIDDLGRRGDGKVLDQPGTEAMPDPETAQPNDTPGPSPTGEEPATDKG